MKHEETKIIKKTILFFSSEILYRSNDEDNGKHVITELGVEQTKIFTKANGAEKSKDERASFYRFVRP